MQGQHFSVDHDVRGSLQVELDAPYWLALGQRMLDVRAVIQPRQVPNQPQATNRSPTNVFPPAAVDLSLGSNHHRSASEFTVVESEEEAAPVVKSFCSLNSNRKRPAPESSESHENRNEIA